MKSDTVKWLIGAGITYYFLSTRIPQYTLQLDGTYLPATFVDRLTVAITGVAPPAPQPQSNQQNIANVINDLVPVIQQFTSQSQTN